MCLPQYQCHNPRWSPKLGMLMVKVAFSLFSKIDHSAFSTLDLSVEQPIIIWLTVVSASLGISNIWEDNSNIYVSSYYLIFLSHRSIDAVFISPHKFVGGPQTPGILVAKKNLFKNEVPVIPGGGTVSYVSICTLCMRCLLRQHNFDLHDV